MTTLTVGANEWVLMRPAGLSTRSGQRISQRGHSRLPLSRVSRTVQTVASGSVTE